MNDVTLIIPVLDIFKILGAVISAIIFIFLVGRAWQSLKQKIDTLCESFESFKQEIHEKVVEIEKKQDQREQDIRSILWRNGELSFVTTGSCNTEKTKCQTAIETSLQKLSTKLELLSTDMGGMKTSMAEFKVSLDNLYAQIKDLKIERRKEGQNGSV